MKKLLANTWDMGQEHTTMALTVRIQLKKGYTKNVCVHLCSKAEVVKPNSKMSLWYPKNSGDVAGASKITYILVWQFFSTNKFKRKIYYLLLHSTTATQKLYHTLPQLLKNYEIFYRSNSRWLATSPSILKKADLRYSATRIHFGQSEVPVQR